jgi:hypothetical protein
MQMKAVMKTFSRDEIDRVHDLMLDSNASLEDINESVRMILFLDRREFLQDVEAVRGQAAIITAEATRQIKKFNSRFEYMMKKMQQGIRAFNFNRSAPVREDHSQLKKDEEDHEDTHDGDRQKDEARQDDRGRAGRV